MNGYDEKINVCTSATDSATDIRATQKSTTRSVKKEKKQRKESSQGSRVFEVVDVCCWDARKEAHVICLQALMSWHSMLDNSYSRNEDPM